MARADQSATLVRRVDAKKVDIDVPVRTRTQCVGCAHRAMLYSVKRGGPQEQRRGLR